MTFALAVNYGSRAELARAARVLAQKVQDGELDSSAIDENALASELYTAGLPDPDLLIRTSGEMRLSNYLLWQLAYTEFYVTPTLWPDFLSLGVPASHQVLPGAQASLRGVSSTREQARGARRVARAAQHWHRSPDRQAREQARLQGGSTRPVTSPVEGPRRHREGLTRTTSGAIYALVTLMCLFIGPITTTLLVAGMAWLCCSEFFRICRMGGRMPNESIGLAAALLYPLAAYAKGQAALVIVTFLLLITCACWYVFTPGPTLPTSPSRLSARSTPPWPSPPSSSSASLTRA